jgi:hypothetical protein
MKKIMSSALAAAFLALAGCSKEPETPVVTNTANEIRTIAEAKAYFERQLAGDVLVKSTVQLTDKEPGGWRVEFTGGSPATIDLMNGSDPVNGLTPKLVVRHNADGSTTLWADSGEGLVDTRVGLTGAFEAEVTSGRSYVPPMIDVRRDTDGTLTVWYNPVYGYPEEGWKSTEVKLRAGSGKGSVAEQGPIRAIIDNEARGVIAIWLNDEEHTVYTFDKFSSAYRFNIMNDDLVILEGETARLLMVASSSEAWVPTGAGEWIDRWQLNEPGSLTRAGYVQPCPYTSIETILPSGRGEGEYIVTIRGIVSNFNMVGRSNVHALVLNTNTEKMPRLISSTRFNIHSALPESGNSILLKPNSSVDIMMMQVIKEYNAGFVSAPRIGVDDDVTADWVWAGKPGTLTSNGIVSHIEVMSEPGSGLNTRIRVTSGPVEGNVVVAAKVGGRIVWSWHIWVTEYDPETQNFEYTSTGESRLAAPDAGKSHVFMDRNLGALSNSHLTSDDDSSFGMFYQWGRKDPLPGAWYQSQPGVLPSIYVPDPETGGEKMTTLPLSSPRMTAGIRYSIEHPGEFIYTPSTLTGFWSWNDLSVETLAELWYDGTDISSHVTKSVYDPCPAGWRLPSKGILEGFNPSDDPDQVIENQGYYTIFGYLPLAGYMDYMGNIQPNVGRYAFYTSQHDIPIWFSEWSGGIRLETSGGTNLSKYGSNAYSVRCIKED